VVNQSVEGLLLRAGFRFEPLVVVGAVDLLSLEGLNLFTELVAGLEPAFLRHPLEPLEVGERLFKFGLLGSDPGVEVGKLLAVDQPVESQQARLTRAVRTSVLLVEPTDGVGDAVGGPAAGRTRGSASSD
jgi:hypothetical protein